MDLGQGKLIIWWKTGKAIVSQFKEQLILTNNF